LNSLDCPLKPVRSGHAGSCSYDQRARASDEVISQYHIQELMSSKGRGVNQIGYLKSNSFLSGQIQVFESEMANVYLMRPIESLIN